MKVLVVSHSYVVEENFKNITELSQHAEVQSILPDKVSGMFENVQYVEVGYHPESRVFKRIGLPRDQYFLLSYDLGMRAFQPDIVNVEYDPWCPIFWQIWLYRLLYARKAKLVCTVKKNTYRRAFFPFQLMKDSVFRLLSGSVDRFVAINRGVARIYSSQLGVSADRIVTMQHLGTDTKLFKPGERTVSSTAQPAAPLIIGYAGRLAEHKGVLDLVQACHMISQAGRTIKLKLLGGGPLETHLAALGYDWLEIFPPVRHEEVAGFLQGLDLFVMPARITPDHEEHDGHAVMEALSCGVPCLGSSSGVLPELVDHEQGYMFKANDPADLARKLGSIIDNPSRHTALALEDRARAIELYSVERIAKDRIDLYESLLK